ncbi:reverse transcriptase-like protein [Paenalkalicoccus suaedae]|uniref:Reverse transcriptase-like protein n=1 Tax=Paenalkalicoccus suaedae TaxID=2592382 RepID=A0A859FD68_9BACI|nr:reverse transcriptase-like protein [Paenalkalicoccus suaedae]QKS71303.1 reverse transcriptase-like protein [Paenalkalicoccus suaedae]
MIEVYIDGASAGNPGASGAGIFIKAPSGHIKESIPLPPMSNHEAEFYACLKAVKRCKEEGFRIISIRSDSKIVVDAVEKQYVKKELYKPMLQEIISMMEHDFDYAFIKWIPTKSNGEADHLAKKAIRQSLA